MHVILACLSAPALQVLRVETSSFDVFEYEDFGAVSEFIIRSACPLVELCIPMGMVSTDREVLHVLRHIPTLEKLHLGSDILTEHYIEQLTPSSSTGPLRHPVAPNLHTIKFEGLRKSLEQHPHLLFDMIQPRWHGSGHSDGGHANGMPSLARLQSIELYWRCGPRGASGVPQSLLNSSDIDRLRSEGLHIVCGEQLEYDFDTQAAMWDTGPWAMV